MQLRDNAVSYGTVTRWLHWGTATLIVMMLALGWGRELFSEDAERALMSVHISLGIAILALAAARVAWRLMNPRRPPREADLTGRLATAVQWSLLALLLLMPLTGWLLVNGAGHVPGFFGLFSLPSLVGKSESMKELSEGIHETLPWVLVGVLALHILGALKHHYFDRDATLRRMVRAGGAGAR
ncbi:MAG TPA: cytochrome b [Gammaproteobacteria bacterium]|nr:cytochrome b [Gammaproteobacteria bacterium]